MGKPTGFLEFSRELPADRSPLARGADFFARLIRGGAQQFLCVRDNGAKVVYEFVF